jgi:hypothetical protein
MKEKISRISEDRQSRDLYVYRKQRETGDLKNLKFKLGFNFTKIICEVTSEKLDF